MYLPPEQNRKFRTQTVSAGPAPSSAAARQFVLIGLWFQWFRCAKNIGFLGLSGFFWLRLMYRWLWSGLRQSDSGVSGTDSF